MSFALLRRVLPLLALVGIAACQPLPHPFADNRPPRISPLTSPPDAAGIVVSPVSGAPAPAARALAEAMAAALRKQDVPADTHAANARSYHLAAAVTARPAGDNLALAIDWRLTAADGKLVGHDSVSRKVAALAWQRGDPDLAKTLVADAAPALAKRIEGDVPVEHKPPAAAKPVIRVAAVTGASGDGAGALTRAMADALHRAGFELADTRGAKVDFRLAGKVAIGPPHNGKQEVKIVWVLSRTKHGEIGRVNQDNAVTAHSLDHHWGQTAYDVAQAAVSGVVELIRRAQGAGT